MRDEIAALRAENPEISAADIAKKLGISRERVRLILVSLGLPTKTPRIAMGRKTGSGQRLTLIRERLHGGIGQRAFAERLGVDYPRYNNWERGHSIPIDMAERIKRITPGITADWLYWGDIYALTVQVLLKLYPAPKDKETD